MLMKGASMFVVLGAMIVYSLMLGLEVSTAEIIIFSILILSGLSLALVFFRGIGGRSAAAS